MKVIILDKIVEELKSKDEAILYGIKAKDKAIITSLDDKQLDELGIFSKEDLEVKPGMIKLAFPDNKLEAFLSNIKVDYEIINYRTDFNKRNHGIVDESVLQDRTVTIIGLGSGGSAIVLDLARCGVERFILVEHDSVEVSNLCRSVYDLADIGSKKLDAILPKLKRINPFIKVEAYPVDIFNIENKTLQAIIAKSDLIIDATDNFKTKLLINGLAYHQKPVIYPAVYSEGVGGDILYTIPDITPCYECVFSQIIPEMQELKKGDWDYTTGTSKPMASLIADIEIVVARTVKIALAILTGDQENSFIDKITEPDSSLLFISNQRGVFDDDPFTEFWGKTDINEECWCQTLQ